MNLSIWDWGIVAGSMLIVFYAAVKTRIYNRSVADFLSANRCAGRYLLAVGDGSASIGAISIVAMFEAYYRSGFSFHWWGLIVNTIVILISVSGWVQYRFRETRALTMAQFFEIRYSKNFRIYAGLVAFISGTLNFGIFPAVMGRFFMHFAGLPSFYLNLGTIEIDLTYAAIMLFFILLSLYMTFCGGQISIMLTDFLQGVMLNIGLILIVGFLISRIAWSDVLSILHTRPAGQSMLNPFDFRDIAKFNMWYYLIAAFGRWWCWMAWQGNQGFCSSALNPHEARMGRILGSFRVYTQDIILLSIPIFAYVIMQHQGWTDVAQQVGGVLDNVSTNPNDTIRQQVQTSVILSKVLPTGLLGVFMAVMISAHISTEDAYLHSWGSIFIQDVILPLRKKRLSPQEHIVWLKWSIVGVAVFVFLFSLLFAQYDAILMFFALTGLLFIGGGGTCIVFGLYWKRGTTMAAYWALTVGVVAFIFGITIQKLWPLYHDSMDFPIDSQQLWFFSMIVSIVLYVLISLMGKSQVFNMEKLLHRGAYEVKQDNVEKTDQPLRGWRALFGMSNEFTLKDRIIYVSITCWSLCWGLIFVIGTIWGQFVGIGPGFWDTFWYYYVWMTLILSLIVTVWLSIGGFWEIPRLFKRLSTLIRDHTDNGEIVGDLCNEEKTEKNR
jgi:SSS family solute:Na+ symporter